MVHAPNFVRRLGSLISFASLFFNFNNNKLMEKIDMLVGRFIFHFDPQLLIFSSARISCSQFPFNSLRDESKNLRVRVHVSLSFGWLCLCANNFSLKSKAFICAIGQVITLKSSKFP